MKPIPKYSEIVVLTIRRLVARPKALPSMQKGTCRLRWWRTRKWAPQDSNSKQRARCCPLGLIGSSITPIPTQGKHLGLPGVETPVDSRIKSFYNWWDELRQEDAQEAVDAVWGKE